LANPHYPTVDPITQELIRSALDALVDEMALTLVRTAYSSNLKNSLDLSAAVCDVDGRLVAQGLTLPLHLGSVPEFMRAVLARFGEQLRPGDLYVTNDPYEGGSHLPDIYLCRPVFAAEVSVGFLVCIAHHTDIGGRTPGGNGCDATELYQEGLRIPLVRLYDRGEANDTVFEFLARNVRIPRQVLGDLRAQLAALHAGERGLHALLDHYGVASVAACCESLLREAEERARAEIAAWPDGCYTFTDYLDDDGIDPGPIPITVTLTVAGDRVIVDFAGTAAQVRGGINCPLSFSQSAVYACLRCLMPAELPNNEGYFRPIDVRIPPGTLLHPLPPAPVAARGLTGFRVANAVFGALAQVLPDRVPAAEIGGDTGVSMGGYLRAGEGAMERGSGGARERPDEIYVGDDDTCGPAESLPRSLAPSLPPSPPRPFVFLEFLYGSWGGRPEADGIDGVASAVVNFSNNPIEVLETELPLRIEQYAYVADTGGPGRFRGGLSLVRDFRLLADEAVLQVRADRMRHRPYGLQGGASGASSRNILNPDGEARVLPPKPTLTLYREELFRHVAAGAGGWGDPFERDPQRVLDDVREEKVTIAHAREAYRVVIDPVSLAVDEEATAVLRGSVRC
jgi:N-methylhydantoinase B